MNYFHNSIISGDIKGYNLPKSVIKAKSTKKDISLDLIIKQTNKLLKKSSLKVYKKK